MKQFHKIGMLLCITLLFLINIVSAAHFIIGEVKNALDSTSANGKIITLWNPSNGLSDNITDIIGQGGNSGVDNFYMIDCELLNTPCNIGDTIYAKVFDSFTGYPTQIASISVTGSGFDSMPSLTLNSPPNVSLILPTSFFNTSSTLVNFSCFVNDLDGNLANVTLYGNWSGAWIVNQTLPLTGFNGTVNFSLTLSEGRYGWNCIGTDNLSVNKFSSLNKTFTVDLTPPILFNITSNNTNICGNTSNIRLSAYVNESLTSLSTVTIQTTMPNGSIQNNSASFLTDIIFYRDLILDQTGIWMFRVFASDIVNNTGTNVSSNITVVPNLPDLQIQSENIKPNTFLILENNLIMFNATVNNLGCGSANRTIIGFYNGDPSLNGQQIGQNETISLSAFSNITLNFSFITPLGPSYVYVVADINNTHIETNETNNKANITFHTPAWQIIYGNTSFTKILALSEFSNLTGWNTSLNSNGNIYITDVESMVSWNNLGALGKNLSGSNSQNDFSELDSMLNMTGFNDSISNIFSIDGSIPITLTNLLVHQTNVFSIPIINSTNSSNFFTGILWDKSDDSNGEFNILDKEDVVFVTKLNPESIGKYGTYDYEVNVPVKLREYYSTDQSEVYLYFDLE